MLKKIQKKPILPAKINSRIESLVRNTTNVSVKCPMCRNQFMRENFSDHLDNCHFNEDFVFSKEEVGKKLEKMSTDLFESTKKKVERILMNQNDEPFLLDPSLFQPIPCPICHVHFFLLLLNYSKTFS